MHISRVHTITLSFSFILAALPLVAQNLVPDARQIAREASQNELNADQHDQSHWQYRDDQRDIHTVSIVVETPNGALKRPILKDGRPLTSAEAQAAEQKMQRFMHDPAAQRKQQRDAAQDDKRADEFLQLLPRAFIWSLKSEGSDTITLDFQPDPSFHPPDMESRVLCAMSGQVIVDKAQRRMRSIRGTLTQDVTFGWGILGRMERGGTFDVERRQVTPGYWQITSATVHIHGHALFFKTISEEQDEVKSNFVKVPNSTTLEQAATMLQNVTDQPESTSAHASR